MEDTVNILLDKTLDEANTKLKETHIVYNNITITEAINIWKFDDIYGSPCQPYISRTKKPGQIHVNLIDGHIRNDGKINGIFY